MMRHLTLRYLPLAWSGLAFTALVFAFLGSIVRGDPSILLKEVGISIDVFAMTTHEIGLLIGTAITLYSLSKREVGLPELGLKNGLKAVWIAYAVVGFTVAMLLYPVVEGLIRWIGAKMLWWDTEELSYSSTAEWCLMSIVAVVLAPVVEELFFRGYLLTSLLEKMRSKALAVCASSLVFTSIHAFIGPGMMVYIFLWSLIPSYLYLRTGSLYPAVLMHAFNNAFAYVIIPVLA